MKTYIPKQPKHVRERIEVKLDARLVQQLEKYCLYLDSDRDYVLAQVLELIFRKDKGFSEWLAAQGETTSVAIGRTVREERAPVNQQTPSLEPATPPITPPSATRA